ncbi:MAG: TfuA-like protein, partial [Pseudomonadota bacterium]
MSARPVVYLGPSARPEAVLRHLPDAVLRPPIKRGDLHRDRLLRFSVFVVIDGVFAQEEALSPREVVDVIADGGRFVGAASMGALRAADCAPAGALGVGAVYRLFRRRVISSEDEVAVTFLPGVGAVTLSLVSIRWALHRGWRRGALSRARAEALFAAAQALPYTERTWQRICAAAPDGPR